MRTHVPFCGKEEISQMSPGSYRRHRKFVRLIKIVIGLPFSALRTLHVNIIGGSCQVRSASSVFESSGFQIWLEERLPELVFMSVLEGVKIIRWSLVSLQHTIKTHS
jgi:hypothetical protein